MSNDSRETHYSINTGDIHNALKHDYSEKVMKIYDALCEKGYNPIAQISMYILTEDPTYITAHNGARNLANKIDRDELLSILVEEFIKNHSA